MVTVEFPEDWDRYLPDALFAYREFPQKSIGFSSNELIFGTEALSLC